MVRPDFWNFFLLSLLFHVVLRTASAQPAQHYRVTVIDDLDHSITLTSIPTRIISLAPSITETLFAIGAGDQIAAVTQYCNYPAEASVKSRVGGMINPNIETIVSLKPDLIVLSMEGNAREDFSKLQSLGVPIFVTNPRDLEGIYRSITALGRLTGHIEQSDSVVRTMQGHALSLLASTRALVQRSVLFIVSLKPLIVSGKSTFLGELIQLAGARNIADGSTGSYPVFSREAVIAENPDVIIMTSGILSEKSELTDIFPEWSHLTALRSGRIYRINADLVSRPGPRAIQALQAIHHLIHQGTE